MNNPYATHQCPRCFGLFKVGDRFWNDSGTVYHWSCWVNKRKEKNTAIDLAKAAPPKREWEPRALDEMAEANKNLAPWLSAALEDDNACDEFKSAVRWWFSSGSYDMQSMTRRVWQGLTDEEIFDVIRSLCIDNETAEMLIHVSMDEYRAIEAKLKEKNT